MNTPQPQWIDCAHAGAQPGLHRMAYWRWGRADHPHVVLCVHGISRQGRDFTALAEQLIGPDGQRCQVISVDVVGRGMSDWLSDSSLYQISQYVSDLATLVQALRQQGAQHVDWVGTSMGGLIGMGFAAQTSLNPTMQGLALRKLVLNDVGPVVQWSALQRIRTHLGADPRFSSEKEAVDYLWSLSQGFGPHTPAQWLALSGPVLREAGGQFKLHYDPAIADAVRATTLESAAAGQSLLWQMYDAITCPTLLLRGQESDLLSPETAREMGLRGPKARLVSFTGVGHAPTLVVAEQIQVIQDFLQET